MVENLNLRNFDVNNIFMEPFSADFAPKFIQKRTLLKNFFTASNGISKYLACTDFRTAEKVAKS